MAQDERVEIPGEVVDGFKIALGQVVEAVMNGMTKEKRLAIDAHLQAGAAFYIHCQMYPSCVIAMVLAQPNEKPLELARFEEALPEEFVLN